ncbi:MAG: hypothetical protein HQL57_10160 [Magnetococcales bacterium]|nr:hypothetical protein [Magnetococcales bacterium]MBF0157535.1 hypothetical protein [Magnetococcales bacterium]
MNNMSGVTKLMSSRALQASESLSQKVQKSTHLAQKVIGQRSSIQDYSTSAAFKVSFSQASLSKAAAHGIGKSQ